MKYKNIFSLFIALLISQLLFADTLTIVHYKNYYPYAFVNQNGTSKGALIDYWTLWAKVNNQKVKFIATNENNFNYKIDNNEADIIAGTIINDTSATVLDFAEYILRINTILFLNKKQNPKSIHDVDFTILILKNYNTLNILSQNFPDLKYKACNSINDLKLKIQSGNYKGFIYDYPSPINSKTNFKIPKGYYSFYTLSTNKLRPAVKKGNNKLRNLIITGSDKIYEKDLAVIANKWDIIKNNYTIYWIIGLFIFIISVLTTFYIYTLKKQSKQAKQIANFESSQDWQVIINKGENDYIEFKSSFRWDYYQEKPNKALEQVIAKTITAFLNTNGGMLFIGVDDDGNTLGLENDYNSFSKKNSDGFNLAITNLINQLLGKNTHKYITINIIAINNKDICIVTVEKSKTPVFIGKGDKEEFYIRASASSQPLGIREAYKYINSHWEK